MTQQPLELTSPNNLVSTAPTFDLTFRRIVAFSTALGFATVLGSEACLERGVDRGFELHWHWRAIFWMAIGIATAFQLWRLVWRVDAANTVQARTQLIRFCVAMMVGAVGIFLYPILFVTGEQLHEVIFGLCLAILVLTFVGWMISRVVRGFVASDAMEEAANPRKS